MTGTHQRLAAWAAEIRAELDESRSALAASRAEYANVSAAAEDAATIYRELQGALAAVKEHPAGFTRRLRDSRFVTRTEDLGPPIMLRVDECNRQMKAAGAAAARAGAQVEELDRKASELERSLAQLDRLLSPADTKEEAA
ncbi:MAG: hypothetical protein WB823_10960 [Steroidobacteraceae bacterium]